MIRQQINLYVRQEKVRVPFSAAVCALIALVVVILVGGVYGLESRELAALKARHAATKAATEQKKVEIANLRQQNAARREDPQLVARRDRLQQELQARQLYGKLLAQLDAPQRAPFSALLQGLSKQAVNGVWLTRISAREGGARLQLHGETTQAELIPRYLRNLGREASYAAAHFDDFQISEQEGRLQFAVKGLLQPGGSS